MVGYKLSRRVEVGHGFLRACLLDHENSVGGGRPDSPVMAHGNCALQLERNLSYERSIEQNCTIELTAMKMFYISVVHM